jgi:hypothetical protein
MNKAFHAVLALVAVGGALAGAMPASAGFGTIVNTAHPVGTGHTLVNLSTAISGSTGTVLASGATWLQNTSAAAQLSITSSVGAQYQSLVAIVCSNGGASDYSVGFANTVNCPTGGSIIAPGSEAFINVD